MKNSFDNDLIIKLAKVMIIRWLKYPIDFLWRFTCYNYEEDTTVNGFCLQDDNLTDNVQQATTLLTCLATVQFANPTEFQSTLLLKLFVSRWFSCLQQTIIWFDFYSISDNWCKGTKFFSEYFLLKQVSRENCSEIFSSLQIILLVNKNFLFLITVSYLVQNFPVSFHEIHFW